ALRTICLSGEVLLPATVRQFREVFGDGVELVNFYGASETTMIRCHHRIVAADVERGYIPIGKPIAATQMIVLDADGVACPVGTP
ncbi:AMP-binding protein, partial [Duganella sp. HSC-15S17]